MEEVGGIEGSHDSHMTMQLGNLHATDINKMMYNHTFPIVPFSNIHPVYFTSTESPLSTVYKESKKKMAELLKAELAD